MALKAAKPVLKSHAAEPPLVSYVVLVEATNGMKIAGKRRARGETFSASPRHMAFLVREGVVALESSGH